MSHRWFWPLGLLGAAAIGWTLFSTAAQSQALLAGDEALRARYALPNSKFMSIDGETIHYVDEGHGPAVVLVHGSYGNLRTWTDWITALSGRYRVIRFDRPPTGLSGPDPKGDYSVPREAHIIDALTRNLGVERFYLVATSSGGGSGVKFAAEHPERIEGIILSNIAVAPYKLNTDNLSPQLKEALKVDAERKGDHLPEFWRQILLANIKDASKVTPELVREWTELNARARNMPVSPEAESFYASLDHTPAQLASIVAPALALWSADDVDTPLEPYGRRTMAFLGSKDKTLVVIPNCGHIQAVDCGKQSAAAAATFLDRISASRR